VSAKPMTMATRTETYSAAFTPAVYRSGWAAASPGPERDQRQQAMTKLQQASTAPVTAPGAAA